MKPSYMLLLFITVVIAYFSGMAFNSNLLQSIFKPLLVSALLGYFLSVTKDIRSGLKKWTISALFFSAVGDTLLLFANNNELFFIWGLVGFLTAHVFYIICFHSIKTKEAIQGKWYMAIIVGVYYFFIMSFLLPHLGALKIPVMIYGIVISFMLFVAMHLYDLQDNKTGRYIFTGAILFILSDSVLAINKFYHPVAWGGWAIMSTYILAQWLLVKGIILYLKNA